MSYSLALEWNKYLHEVVSLTSPFGAGLARGDLMSFCLSPMERLGGNNMPIDDYLDAAFNLVSECEGSIARGGRQVEINYQPTARNTISCHMNRLKGFDCVLPQ